MKRPFIMYAPEIEKRRAEYKKLAEGLIILLERQNGNVISALDVESPGWVEPDHGILWFGIQEHLKALFENLTHVAVSEGWNPQTRSQAWGG